MVSLAIRFFSSLIPSFKLTQWRSVKFLKGEDIISTFFPAQIFFGRTNLKLIEKQERVLGVGGHAPPKIFENLHAVTAILVLFE